MSPQCSIIIPCYNQGKLLLEALQALKGIDVDLAEVIIVDDGSTDEETIDIIRSLSTDWAVYSQSNQGLPSARNKAISVAKGEYIFPLDSDNKIRLDYIRKGIEILDNDPDVSVVYSDAEYFGEKNGIWSMGEFNMQKLMIANYIDACALIRKSTLLEVGNYDSNMKQGWEDWDLWLRIAFAGKKFHYIPEPLFKYRVTSSSMSKALYRDYKIPNSIENYIHSKYPERMGHDRIVDYFVARFRKRPFNFIAKLLMRTYFMQMYNKKVSKGKFRNGL